MNSCEFTGKQKKTWKSPIRRFARTKHLKKSCLQKQPEFRSCLLQKGTHPAMLHQQKRFPACKGSEPKMLKSRMATATRNSEPGNRIWKTCGKYPGKKRSSLRAGNQEGIPVRECLNDNRILLLTMRCSFRSERTMLGTGCACTTRKKQERSILREGNHGLLVKASTENAVTGIIRKRFRQ